MLESLFLSGSIIAFGTVAAGATVVRITQRRESRFRVHGWIASVGALGAFILGAKAEKLSGVATLFASRLQSVCNPFVTFDAPSSLSRVRRHSGDCCNSALRCLDPG